jgi:2-oxoisovalerate dehydrogenase E1 component
MMHPDTLLKAYGLMCTAGAMAQTYEANRAVCKYVHSTSRGHEAIQLATAFQLLPCDYALITAMKASCSALGLPPTN